MLPWQWVLCILEGFLILAWPGSNGDSLDMHNHTAMAVGMEHRNSTNPDTYWWLWFMAMESSQCPFMKLIFHSILTLPVYNLILIFVGWRMNKSTANSAQDIVLVLKPAIREPPPAPTTPPAPPVPPLPPAAQPMPPSPPPRRKRHTAAKMPQRRVRDTPVHSPDNYPIQQDTFALQNCNGAEQYKSLRRNLKRVLEGLQQPVQPAELPLPLPIFNSLDTNRVETSSPTQSISGSVELPKKKRKKWLSKLIKRLGKPFAKSSAQNEIKVSEHTPRSSGVWQHFKFRSSRKSHQIMTPTSESSDTISSGSCLYA